METVSAPYGPLALTGTHWLEDYPDGHLPDIPGVWVLDGDAGALTVPADERTGPTRDGEPFTGSVRLGADTGPVSTARVGLGGRRPVVLVGEGVWGVRDYDPGTADGVERGLGVAGELAFRLDGLEVTSQVAVQDDGTLWAVFADSTGGDGSYRFPFLYPAAPDAEGRTTVDFNRAVLPPCAFADHFICPFPPPGNTLGLAIEAGERVLRQTVR
ncbi:DUF1684 domain-containing protein [Streptomyces sp. NBC_01288]|uniref:DUF1684 domain-containing protein n=1 Tax=Streptomyces sp. NBC_01288 TaxID=2903814 RepID=UPI002E0E9E56|nr:DUF1684 domain-containing protein [Streptomyces sp. NBC_01288]